MTSISHIDFPSTKAIRLLTAVICSLLAASPAAAQDVDFSGFGATGMRSYNQHPDSKYTQEFYYEGKLQADITFSKDIEGQLDFRGASDDREVVLREFSVKFKYWTYAKIKFGNVKKPFSLEGLADRDEYIPVFDSYIHRRNSELGYAGRNVGLVVYYNYKKKRPQFPFSYAVGVFKNQSYVTSMYARGSWHAGDFITSLGYSQLARSHDNAITTHGMSFDAGYMGEAFESGIELFYVQDPDESIRRSLLNLDDEVFSTGAKSLSAFRLPIGGKVVHMIEPFLLVAYYVPDSEVTDYHTIEFMPGVNVFLDDDVRLRITADALYTKDRYSTEYNMLGSLFALEVFVKF